MDSMYDEMARAQKDFKMYPSNSNWDKLEATQLAYQQAWREHEDLVLSVDWTSQEGVAY
jgi:hypothetical protein